MTAFVKRLTNSPTANMAKTVPRPTPRMSPNSANDSAKADATNATSNMIRTLSIGTLVTSCIARTSPSSASMDTFASTSRTMPKPMSMVLSTRNAHCAA